jgi:drug/metabolite transporter (DMT)-like permease
MCQWFYFESISRIPITISLLIEFMAPIFVVLFVRYVWHQPVKSTVWIGIALSMSGLALVQQVWKGMTLNTVGVLFAIAAMVCLVIMYIVGDKASRGRDPMSLVMWAFIFSAIFFAVLRPWTSFPWDAFTATVKPFETHSLTMPIWPFFTYMVIGGTVLPYLLVITGMKHIGGAGAAIMGITEPPIAAVIAWVVLGESLNAIQIVGGFVILLGVLLAENAREHSSDEPEHVTASSEVSETVNTQH